MKTHNNGAMKQWVKPTVEVASMNAAQLYFSNGHLDGLGSSATGPYYSS